MEVDQDYYWFIPEDSLYNPYETPKDLTLGQLWEEWKGLREVLTEERDMNFLDIIWLSGIFRYLGHRVSL